MWLCSRCGKDCDDDFEVCWNCCAVREGIIEAELLSGVHSDPEAREGRSPTRKKRKSRTRAQQVARTFAFALVGAGLGVFLSSVSVTQAIVAGSLGGFIGFALSLPGVSAGNVVAEAVGLIVARNVTGRIGRRVADALLDPQEVDTHDLAPDDPVLVSGTPDEIYGYACDTNRCVVVDWREDDETIVKSVAETIPEAALSYHWTDTEPPDLMVAYGQRRIRLGLTCSPRDRYVVLRGLNALLAGDYELRVFRITLETDTHSFLVKPVLWWVDMDRNFPQRMAALFVPLSEEVDFV